MLISCARPHDWDARLFLINQLEAENMDPQHLLALEVVYRALENAGLSPKDVAKTNTAVFVGRVTLLVTPLRPIVHGIK